MIKEYQEGKYTIYENVYVKYYRVNNKLHRDDDLPAVEYPDGTKEWYQYGKRHRINGPSVKSFTGYINYYINGKFYSEKDYYKAIKLLAFL